MSAEEVVTQQTGPNQVVHQRSDSTHELDILFENSLKNISQNGGNQSSWHNRTLPESFFRPSANRMRNSHSPEGSIDGSQHGDQHSPMDPNRTNFGQPAAYNHSRIASCPAEMGGMPQQKRNAGHHSRSPSLGMILDERPNLEHIPLPPGWEAAATPDGKRYFIE